jgi:tRNA-2-methylthio-N6-dimethylallyladenosine synthase
LYADDVPEEVKKRRNNDLLQAQGEASAADHRRWIGATVEVLVEGPSKWAGEGPNRDQLTGRTMTDHIVVFDGPARLTGQLVRVAIRDASPFTLFGDVETVESVGVVGDREPAPAATARVRLPLV